MKGCKLCSTTTIVGCLALVGLGIAGYATVTGKNIFGSRNAAAATSDKGGCCSETSDIAAVALEESGCSEAASGCHEAVDAGVMTVSSTAEGECTDMSECTEKSECAEKSECTEKKECPLQTAETPTEGGQG